MINKDKTLLLIDSMINIVIGLILLCYPLGIARFLDLPESGNNFYPMILGAVIFGIGIALLIDYKYSGKGKRGLGLDGAIIINIAASSVLIIFLIFGALNIGQTGFIILWIIGILVFGIGIIELFRKKLFK